MSNEEYLAEMAECYNHSRVPKEPGAADSFRSDIARRISWAKPIVGDLQALLEGKRVLEVACGMGRWTQLAADIANQVIATDVSPKLLDNVRGLPLPRQNAAFVLLRGILAGRGTHLHFSMNKQWWWAHYSVA